MTARGGGIVRWKIMASSAAHPGSTPTIWSLGYSTKRAAVAAVIRLRQVSPNNRFTVEKMTAEDEALASELERAQ